MEKLIELLNKFEREVYKDEHKYVEFPDWTRDDWWYWYIWNKFNVWEEDWLNYSIANYRDYNSELVIISKKFWFIKWLVENDKIDLDKVEKKFYNEICTTDYWDKDRAYWKSNLVISVLSISNNPIQDLLDLLV